MFTTSNSSPAEVGVKRSLKEPTSILIRTQKKEFLAFSNIYFKKICRLQYLDVNHMLNISKRPNINKESEKKRK